MPHSGKRKAEDIAVLTIDSQPVISSHDAASGGGGGPPTILSAIPSVRMSVQGPVRKSTMPSRVGRSLTNGEKVLLGFGWLGVGTLVSILTKISLAEYISYLVREQCY